jgi:phage terminase large subunit
MSRDITIQASRIFEENYNATERFIINIGGTRSTKTWSILQTLIVKALSTEEPFVCSIVRKSFPSLKITSMKDFFDLLRQMDLYDDNNHSKMDNTYLLNNCLFQFFSIDDAQKKRGSKRDYLFLNEANELDYVDFFELNIRTTKQIFADFNPSETFWYNDKLQHRDDVKIIHSTYLDNPFLPKGQIEEIERLKETDSQYWEIYGLGQFAGNRKLVYQYNVIDDIPINKAKMVGIGLDWGYTNDPTAVVELWNDGTELYVNELIYERGLTNNDLGALLKHIGVDRYTEIFCDSAEPKSITELCRLGFNAKPVVKGADSILNGIDIVKRHRLNVTKDSVNVINELSRYKWMENKDGVMLNRPIDAFNHSLDAMRYCCMMKLNESKKQSGRYNISVMNSGASRNIGSF